jgi:hypothetical protein
MGKSKKKKNNVLSIESSSDFFTEDRFNTKIEFIKQPPKPPLVNITQEAFDKMMMLVSSCSFEIGWFAVVDHIENELVVSDVIIIPKQEVSGVTVNISAEDVGDMFSEMMKLYGKDTATQMLNKIRLYGHSHVNMGVSPSGTDTNQMLEYAKDFDPGDNPYFVMIILNKRKEVHISLLDMTLGIKHVDAPYIIGEENNELRDWAVKEITEKVTEKKFVTYDYPGLGSYEESGSYTPQTPSADVSYDQDLFSLEKPKRYKRMACLTDDEFMEEEYHARH